MKLSQVINNSIALTTLDVVSKLIPLVTFPWVVRALGPATYGNLGFAMSVAAFFGLIAAPGFATFGMREVAREPERATEVARDLMGARLVFASTSYLLLVVYTFTLAPHDAATRTLLLLAGLTFLAPVVDLQWLFAGASRMWPIAFSGIIGQVIYAGVILTLVRRASDAWVMPIGASLATLVGATLLAQLFRNEGGFPTPRFRPQQWAEFLPICLTLALASMMSMIYDQIDTIMLRYMRSEHELGLYVASYRVMGMGLSFMPILGRVFFPILAGAAKSERRQQERYMQWLANATFAMAIPMVVGGFIVVVPLTRLVLGLQYVGADSLVRVLLLNLVAGPLASVAGAQLLAHGRDRKYLVATMTGALINIGLNLVLIPRYGAMAAAWTTIGAQIGVATLNYYFSRDLPRPNLREALVVSLAASGLMAAFIGAVMFAVQVHVTIVIGLGALIYGAAFLLARKVWDRLFPPHKQHGEELAVLTTRE